VPSSSLECGRSVARLLSGAWRASPPPLALAPAELARVAPLVLATGAGALACWRLRSAGLLSLPEADPFRQAYRLHTLEVAVQEGRLPQAFARLRAAGIEPVLGKGWAVARHYPESGLRPYGDIDVFVPPDRRAAAAAALHSAGGPPLSVDLHAGWADLDDRDPAEVLARSRTAALAGVDVRTFGPEDHLRLVSLHALRHGLERPLWLCDVAALVEARPRDFDWDYFRKGEARRWEAIASALALASRVLGADLGGAPADVVDRPVPAWLEPAVIRQWAKGSVRRRNIEQYLHLPARTLRELPRHWPNPLAATMGLGAPFNELPRLPFQLAYAVARGVNAVRRMWGRR
jgi:hypothetical protein